MPSTRQRVRLLLVVLALASLACSTDSGDSDPSGSAESTAASAAESAGIECAGADGCDAVISQATGLVDGDVVRISAGGWEPNDSVGVAQCADPEDPDSPQFELTPDSLPPGEVCNVLGAEAPAETHSADSNGVVEFDYTVLAGETMRQSSEAGVTCDATHDCVVNLFLPGANRFQSDAPRVTFHLTFE